MTKPKTSKAVKKEKWYEDMGWQSLILGGLFISISIFIPNYTEFGYIGTFWLGVAFKEIYLE